MSRYQKSRISKIEASQDGSQYVYVTFLIHCKILLMRCEHDGIYFPRGHDEEFAKAMSNISQAMRGGGHNERTR
ncbi:MAG: hypothetical protein DLM72_13525 [Candidatus Nitrosopolaris wilkensis]|nr:MAG: hypothetical protein DLM72_13525 [Candidatus Nitrosopolaris wilkensis]